MTTLTSVDATRSSVPPSGAQAIQPVAMPPRAEGRALPAGERWPGDTALCLLTYSKNEKYVAPARQNLAMFWPNHPRLFVITDGELSGDDVICKPGLSFAHLLEQALYEIAVRCPEVRYVYLMLEDLTPLGPVDEPYMRAVEDAMRDKGGRYFVTLCQGSGKQRRLPRAQDTFDADADRLGIYEVNPDSQAFNCLVTSWWDADHLRDVLRVKIGADQTDPWAFEHAMTNLTEPHFMVEDGWPTFRSGFLKLGKLSKHLARSHDFPPSPLLSMVEEEYKASVGPIKLMRDSLKRLDVRLRSMLRGVS